MEFSSNLYCLSHKIRCLRHLYTILRDRESSREAFVNSADRIMTLISEEGLALLDTEDKDVITPTGSVFHGGVVDTSNIVAVSIIRAGDSMLSTFLKVVPNASVGKILIQRNEETAEPIMYYSKLPCVVNKTIFLLDPMLATAGSAIAAIETLLKAGASEDKIVFLNVVCCPEGIKRMNETFPAIRIVTGAIDEGLNTRKYILPGLGDFGDRYFGTC